MAANVQCTTAISDFRSALCTYIVEARQALAALEMEARRALEYITQDQSQFWSAEVRRGREKVQQCKLEIHNTRTFKRIGNYTPSCIDEKKELAKAERRLQLAEAKVEAVRHWGRLAEQAFREFQARLAQFIGILDGELPKGVATLERMLVSLDKYFAAQPPVALRDRGQTDEVGSSGVMVDAQPAAAACERGRDSECTDMSDDRQSALHGGSPSDVSASGEPAEVPAWEKP